MSLRKTLAVLPFVLPFLLPRAGWAHPPKWHTPTQLGEEKDEFADPVATLGYWRPASGPTILPELLVAADQLADLVNLAGDGRAVADFERYTIGGEARFALVFSSGEAAEKLLPDEADLKARLAELGPRWHLVDFETFLVNGGRRWAALFRAGAENRSFESGIAAKDLPARLATQRLLDFEVLQGGPDDLSYAVLFEKTATIPQQFFTGLDAEQFHDKAHLLNGQGYRLADVEVWSTPQGSRFAALFEEGIRQDHLWVEACGENCDTVSALAATAVDLKVVLDRLATENSPLRLVDLELLPLERKVELPLGGNDAKSSPKPGPAKTRPRRSGPGGITNPPPPPTGTHAGLLHDAGTNGPP